MENKIWAGFGPIGSTEKKLEADYEEVLGHLEELQLHIGTYKNFCFLSYSVQVARQATYTFIVDKKDQYTDLTIKFHTFLTASARTFEVK